MTERDLQRWSREVAENPGAPSFIRLARAYRRQGRGAAARDVVLAGLGANPEHVGAHALLALIYVEEGDRQKARDEWETIQRLEPGNFDANRGLGFLALERGDLEAARRHLDAAARARADDPAVTQALQVLDRREAAGQGGGAGAPARGGSGAGLAGASGPAASGGGGAGGGTEPAPGEAAGGAAGGGAAPAGLRDPVRLFERLAGETPFLGALVLDAQGLVLAGRLEEEGRQGDLLAALLNTAVQEAERSAELLELGRWGGVLMETEGATLHVTALSGGAVVVLVTAVDAPAGWVVRTAGRARELAERFLEAER